jgi:hypothetical protein
MNKELITELSKWCDNKVTRIGETFVLKGKAIIYKNYNVIHIKIGLPLELLKMVYEYFKEERDE